MLSETFRLHRFKGMVYFQGRSTSMYGASSEVSIETPEELLPENIESFQNQIISPLSEWSR